MEAFDDKLIPPAFGLNNTGVICYLNSFLQALASCTSLTKTIMLNPKYLSRTETGKAMYDFVSGFAAADGAGGVVAREAPAPDIAAASARVLAALRRDLSRRRPATRFGGGQESASEALVLLLDMMEPPGEGEGDGGGESSVVRSANSPITRLFLHRFRCDTHCRRCRAAVSKEEDYSVIFNLFHLDGLGGGGGTPEAFSKAVRLHVSATEGYVCPTCQQKTTAFRCYHLTMVPEIIFAAFNLYVGYGGARRARFFPGEIQLPALNGGKLIFHLVSQVEHSGGLHGGHYWARGLRASRAPGGDPGQVYTLNDTGVRPSGFAMTETTYIVAYHFVRQDPPEAE